MNNIRRFRYVKPIYKKSVILNNRLIINYLKFYKQSNYALVNNNKKSYSNLIKHNDASNLAIYKKLDSDLIIYKTNRPRLNTYLNTYILYIIACYF